VKIVRLRRRPGRQRADVVSFYRHDTVLIPQCAFHQQERLADQRLALTREQIGLDDDVGDYGFVFEARNTKPFAVPGRQPATRTNGRWRYASSVRQACVGLGNRP
jgi:hypothetical protein